VALAGLVAVLVRARRVAEAHARALTEARDQLRAVVEAREATRRDLHDGVLQSLYALTLSLGRARRVMQRDAAEAEALLTQQTGALDEVMADVRRHLGGERRRETAETLSESLRAVADAVGCDGACAVKLDLPAEAEALPERVATHLLNIVREAVSNAHRHGRAREIVVSLQAVGSKWRLAVTDDGTGFAAGKVSEAGHGLRNIDARVAELGGSCRVESRPGGPTRVVVEVERQR
jgi:signal transduction histidine kinase